MNNSKIQINDLSFFLSKIGDPLCYLFMKGLSGCSKLQTNLDLYMLNEKYNTSNIAQSRNRFNIFCDIVANIYEFSDALDKILQRVKKDTALSKIAKSDLFIFLTQQQRDIINNKNYKLIRNQITSHNGEILAYKTGWDLIINDGYFVIAEYSGNQYNDWWYKTANIILASLKISIDEFKILADHTLEIMGKCIDDFHNLFLLVCNDTGAYKLIG